MHDGHAVPHASSSSAPRTAAGSTARPVRTSPGALTSTNPTRPARRFLSPSRAASTAARSTAGSSVVGSPCAASSAATSARSDGLPGQRERREQAERDGLAVAVARVAGGGLDRVPDGVAEVEDLAAPGVALVGLDDRELRPRAGEHEVGVDGRARVADPLPQRAAGDQRGLDHLGPAGRELLRRQRLEHPRVGEHRRGLVVGARVVLALGQVDAGLAAVGRVDLRDERRRELHDRHAALVGGGAEAGQVADHAAAERDHVVVARHPGGRQRAQDAPGLLPRLGRLARRDLDPPRDLPHRVAVPRADGGVGDEEGAARRPDRRRARRGRRRPGTRRTRCAPTASASPPAAR